MQLVVIPLITIGCGVLASILSKKAWFAPIVTFIITSLDELYYFKHYYSKIEIIIWDIILPIVSLAISLMVIPTIKEKKKPPVT